MVTEDSVPVSEMRVELQEGELPHVESGVCFIPSCLHADSLGLSLKDSNSVGLGWGLKFCVFNQFPSDPCAAGPWSDIGLTFFSNHMGKKGRSRMGPGNEEAGERVEGVRALSTFAVLGEEREGGRKGMENDC